MWLAIFMLLGVPIASLISKAGFVVVHEDGGRIRAWSAAACIREVGAVPQRFGRELIGPLLLPAIPIHAILTLLLIRALFKYKSAEASKP